VREHFSDKHVLRIHLLYDVKNAVGTLEWFTMFQMSVFLKDTLLTM